MSYMNRKWIYNHQSLIVFNQKKKKNFTYKSHHKAYNRNIKNKCLKKNKDKLNKNMKKNNRKK